MTSTFDSDQHKWVNMIVQIHVILILFKFIQYFILHRLTFL